ncbi:MAG: CDP-alcohol phosphatidyltransferase family protein, partial [Gammaproteobacteria bacterium]
MTEELPQREMKADVLPSATATCVPCKLEGDTAVRRKLLHFWQHRNAGEPNLLDQYSTHNVSFAIAWFAHVLNITPNQLSVFSGLVSLVAFAAALWLPAAELVFSLFWIFAFAQFAYLLDCADGQLARTTGQESEYGAFLDKGIDIA